MGAGHGHGTVYTPPFLASLLLDQVMPYHKLKGDERVLDPACGSGVFLVGAFRRLVNCHRAKHGWRPLSVDVLKKILKSSIFGIELDANAVDLTAFSLALAVCDALKPDVIWEKLKFDKLRGANLVEGDFFEELAGSRAPSGVLGKNFDIIVGNPPFESALTNFGKAFNDEVSSVRGGLPDKQVAYLFLEQSIKLLSRSGTLCLIQPSGILYNQKAFKFRQQIFQSAAVQTILDFTSIRKLYDAADPKTIAFVINGFKPPHGHVVTHVTFRRTFGTKERISFELDHYDWHRVPQNVAAEDRFIWRLDLLGGGRLVQLSQRFREMETLREFLGHTQLSFGEGFIIGGKKTSAKSFLTGMTYLPTEALTEKGIDRKHLSKVTQQSFHTAYTESRYKSPIILIRKNERLQIALWLQGSIAFTSSIVGIGVGGATPSAVKKIYSRLRNQHETYQLFCAMHGSKAFVAKATAVLKQDIDRLPFPKDESQMKLSFWERVIRSDTLTYFRDFVRLGQNSALLARSASIQVVLDYGALLRRMLASVYQNLVVGAPIFLDGLICQPFYFGTPPDDDIVKQKHGETLRSLIYDKHHESLRTVRMLRIYVDNVMLVVKPDRLRFWIGSAAIRDADETIMSLRDQGY
jgi:methylase of polypeptide subunit release factors